MDKKKVMISLIVLGLLLSGFTLVAGAYEGSLKSDFYHYPSCYHVDRIKPEHLIRFDTVKEACDAGYRPCKDCGPPTCPPTTSPPTPEVTPTPIPSQLPITPGNPSYDSETLRIGAFNIQVFGKSKVSKPNVMDVLAKIIRTYDVMAIQEIRDKSQTALPKLVELVNANGTQYAYIVGERLGRTSSKEQYAYIYNSQTVKLNGTPETYPEPNGTDPFHREPYIASFEVLNGCFDVTLIVIHTDPDEATEEINALDAVVKYTQNKYPDEEDFIVMGDLNADCSYFDEDSNSTMMGSDYFWCINNSIDTTTSATNCTYDRIIITTPAVTDYTGDSGVFRYDMIYNLTEEETKAVSDHYPIYAEFYGDGDASFMFDIDTQERGRSLSVSSSPPWCNDLLRWFV